MENNQSQLALKMLKKAQEELSYDFDLAPFKEIFSTNELSEDNARKKIHEDLKVIIENSVISDEN